MLLAPNDATAFLKLYPAVIGFAAGRLGGVAGIVDLDTFRAASRDSKAEARDHLLDNTTLIDAFINENPSQFRETGLGLVAKWRHFLRGRFVIERHLKDYSIFLDWQEEPKAYAVVGLPPAEADVARYFGVTAPAAHGALLTLQKRGLIERTAGQSRSIRLLLPREQLPDLE